jgi:polyisoprenyl-teichoic acid--peptidoglycan teichoic acid transferase
LLLIQPPVTQNNPTPPLDNQRPTYFRLPPRGDKDSPKPQPQGRSHRRLLGCVLLVIVPLLLFLIFFIYMIAPGRTNILVTGIDYTDPGNAVARTDSIMMTTFVPFKPYIGMLSVPRDLWVVIPGVGENRINTAHFYAESAQTGTGPLALLQTIRLNFGVNMEYYLRIRFEGFRDLVDALGGVDIYLEKPKAGYPVGWQHLTGRKALAFVRDRNGTDDFFRMSDGQLMVKSLFMNMLNPLKWPRIPGVATAFIKSVDTNLPKWMWPRLALLLLFKGPNGIDYHIIDRNMVTPSTTDQGAQVLRPDWNAIYPVVQAIFGNQ